MFLDICRTETDVTWSEPLVTGQEVDRNELPRILGTPRTIQIPGNYNSVGFYCNIYKSKIKKVSRNREERQDTERNLADFFVI